MYDSYENIDGQNPNKKYKILTVFDYMITDMLSNKKQQQELFIRSRKTNMSLDVHSTILFCNTKKTLH